MKEYLGKTIGVKKKFVIVVARFNEFITKRLLDSAVLTLEQAGVVSKDIHVVWVPGALEIPQLCKRMIHTKKPDAVIALGCVLRGGTYHFETVSNEVTRGISQVALETSIPIATGVITADTLEQAIDRAGLKAGNKGAHAAMAALELANLNASLLKTNMTKNKV
jgi:6,7-dimethyl-8-ribityllumazine synthase